MKILRKTMALFLALSMTITVSGIARAADAVTIGAPDISDAEVTELVKAACEKIKNKKTISCAILVDPEYVMYELYDRENDIGAFNVHVEVPLVTLSPKFEELTWIDGKNHRLYYRDIDSSEDWIYRYDVLTKEETERTKTDGLGRLLYLFENGLPQVPAYQYAGNMWVKGTDEKRHLCYMADVPDCDETLFDQGATFCPKRIYIGVDDGEIYRIDQELNIITVYSSQIVSGDTFVSYPTSLVIPDEVKKKAILGSEHEVIKNHIRIQMMESGFQPGEYFMQAVSPADTFKSKTLEIPASVTVSGETYKVKGILDYSFWKMGIKTAKTGKNVEEIGEQAFSSCKQLKNAIVEKATKAIGKNAFKGCKKLKTLIIKNKKLRRYIGSKKGRRYIGIGKKVVVK